MPDQFHQIDKTVLDRIFELQISLSKQPMSFGHQRVDSFQEFLRFCHWMKPKVETSPSLRNDRNEKHQWVILHMVPYLKVHYLSSTDSFWNWSNLREGDVTQLSSSWRKKMFKDADTGWRQIPIFSPVGQRLLKANFTESKTMPMAVVWFRYCCFEQVFVSGLIQL